MHRRVNAKTHLMSKYDALFNERIEALEAKVGGDSSGGGIPTAIIKQDGYDNALMGVAVAAGFDEDPTFTSTNMTYEEAKNIILSGQPLNVVVMTLFKPNDEIIQFSSEHFTRVTLSMESEQHIQIWDYKYPRFFWVPEGVFVDEG